MSLSFVLLRGKGNGRQFHTILPVLIHVALLLLYALNIILLELSFLKTLLFQFVLKFIYLYMKVTQLSNMAINNLQRINKMA